MLEEGVALLPNLHPEATTTATATTATVTSNDSNSGNSGAGAGGGAGAGAGAGGGTACGTSVNSNLGLHVVRSMATSAPASSSRRRAHGGGDASLPTLGQVRHRDVSWEDLGKLKQLQVGGCCLAALLGVFHLVHCAVLPHTTARLLSHPVPTAVLF